MNDTQSRKSLESELTKVEELLSKAPPSVELHFHRATLLRELGRVDSAKQAYLELLARWPTHFGALNNLGALAMETGYQSAARTAYAEAVKHHPDHPMGHVNLANALAVHKDTEKAFRHFEIALRLAPDHPEAHQGLARLLADRGEHEAARAHRINGYQNRSTLTLPYRGAAQPIELLVLASSDGGAVPIWHHLDDQTFHSTILYVDFFNPDQPLPPHQIVFNAIGDADLAHESLSQAANLIQQSTAPVINPPQRVIPTGRADNAKRLRDLPGVITPRMERLPREVLLGQHAASKLAEHGFRFPLLVRSPGYHNGQFFLRAESELDLPSIVAQAPGEQLMVIEYLDARRADGKIRKYRAMMIDQQIYPLHVAISHDWKIHFVKAEMADNPEHRAEDAAFLDHMPQVLGELAMTGLKNIQEQLALDYAGVDFSVNAEGQVLLFEANATMVVNPPDPGSQWDYRRPAVQRILDQFRQLLIRSAKSTWFAKSP